MSTAYRKRNHTKAFGPRTAITCAAASALAYSSLAQLVGAQYLPPVHMRTPPPPLDLAKRQSSSAAGSAPLIIVNNCTEQICPGITSQAGIGPSTTGFCLSPGANQSLSVSRDWQGRVWGRTNCSFPNHGAPNSACMTGDCGGAEQCTLAGQPPVTLAEFTLGGSGATDFYDISIVDGFNIGVSLEALPDGLSTLAAIPPNKTNPSCVGSTASFLAGFNPYSNGSFLGTNSTYPLPFLRSVTKNLLTQWCPWDLQEYPPTKPGGGVYPYPDNNIQRPVFQPCYSTCAKYNQPVDCCAGQYNSPSACKPGLYSQKAKSVCPDAYTYAYDDSDSTFTIPTGGGFQITFCPVGVSTNIIANVTAGRTRQSKSSARGDNVLLSWCLMAIPPLLVVGFTLI